LPVFDEGRFTVQLYEGPAGFKPDVSDRLKEKDWLGNSSVPDPIKSPEVPSKYPKESTPASSQQMLRIFSMTSYKDVWEERYRINSCDWDVILNSPVLDPEGRWTYGGPSRIETELNGVLKLMMGGAPDAQIEKAIERASVVVDAVDSMDLLKTNARHRESEFSHIRCIRGKSVIDLLKNREVSSERWVELGRFEMSLSNRLEGDCEAVCEHRLVAVLYFLLADDYLGALQILDSTELNSGRSEEFSALYGLVCFLVEGEGRDSAFSKILSYFEKARSPTALGLEFRRGLLDILNWALLVGKFVDPGDGELNAGRAVCAMAR